MLNVIKRDLTTEPFDARKIVVAAQKALEASGADVTKAFHAAHFIADEIVSELESYAQHEEEITVPEIHTMVENALMRYGYLDAARAYIEYRQTRDINRESQSKLYADVEGFLNQTCDEFVKENANKPTKLVHTHRDLLAGILSKHLAVTQILPKHIAKAHTDGFIHVHDCDYLVSRPLTNCCLVNYPDMLEKGFTIGNASIGTPNSINVAATILSQIALSVSGAQYGGQTYSHIDGYLVPYVEKTHNKNLSFCKKHGLSESVADEMTEKDVYDSMQCFLYQINTLTSTNGQTPFLTISLGLDTSKFGRMITKNYLMVHKEGIGKDHVTPVFPKVLFFLEEGINMNPEDPNYDLKRLALECSAERIYPDFVSVPLNKAVTGATEGNVTSMGKLLLLM